MCQLAGVKQGLYAGLGPTVLKQAVNSCIRFTTMNELTKLRRESLSTSLPPAAPLPLTDTFLLGACAGSLDNGASGMSSDAAVGGGAKVVIVENTSVALVVQACQCWWWV